MITLSWDQIIAYIITIISVVLFILEKRNNDKKTIYMNLQGQLKAAYAKYKHHYSQSGLLHIRTADNLVTINEYAQYVLQVSLDYDVQVETILGLMKSLELGNDYIYDKNDFTKNDELLKEINERFNTEKKPTESN